MAINYSTIIGLSVVVACSSGCVDYGRIGAHKVTFARHATLRAPSEDEKLRELVRDALAGKGFEEQPGTPYIWRKGGTTVQVYRDKEGELVLKVRAFGSKRDVRVSHRTEQELLGILKRHAELEITSITPPEQPVN